MFGIGIVSSKYCATVTSIEETFTEIDHREERFLSSHTCQNAVAMCILQIGELTKQLSSAFLATHSAIPWRLIAKTRDNYAHHYGAIDFELVWHTAIEDIPVIAEFCREYLNE